MSQTCYQVVSKEQIPHSTLSTTNLVLGFLGLGGVTVACPRTLPIGRGELWLEGA